MVWDSKGFGLACLSSSQIFNLQPIFAKCLVLWRTIELCLEFGLCNMVLEGNVQIGVNAVKNDELD